MHAHTTQSSSWRPRCSWQGIKRSGVKGGGDQSAHRARQGTDEAEKTQKNELRGYVADSQTYKTDQSNDKNHPRLRSVVHRISHLDLSRPSDDARILGPTDPSSTSGPVQDSQLLLTRWSQWEQVEVMTSTVVREPTKCVALAEHGRLRRGTAQTCWMCLFPFVCTVAHFTVTHKTYP